MAILGLAAEMGTCRKGRYLAGLWEDTLLSDLSWKKYSHFGHRPPKSLTRAPTWSWASVVGVCEYRSDWKDSETTVLAVQVPDFDNFLADRRALGCLTLRGRLVTGTSDNSPTKGWHNWFANSFAYGGRANFTFDFENFPETVRCVPDGEPVFCLALGSGSLTTSERCEIGLVMVSLDKDERLYERVGVVNLRPARALGSHRYKSFFDRGLDTTVNII
jgi:hypothetical protein